MTNDMEQRIKLQWANEITPEPISSHTTAKYWHGIIQAHIEREELLQRAATKVLDAWQHTGLLGQALQELDATLKDLSD